MVSVDDDQGKKTQVGSGENQPNPASESLRGPEVPGPGRVDLSPRAHRDPLSIALRARILENLRCPAVARLFSRMWGTFVVVQKLPHQERAGSGHLRLKELTLRFDYGHLVIHGGRVGRPDVTLWGSFDEVLGIGQRLLVRPNALWGGRGQRQAALVSALYAVAWGEGREGEGLQIFGRLSHPRLVYGFARLVQARRNLS